MYGQSEAAQQLAEALAESGHTVELVESEVDLSLEMSSGNYDVVIATFGDHDAIKHYLKVIHKTLKSKA